MIEIVDDLRIMVRQLNTVELTIDKLDIIEKYPQCRNLLEITYNPFKSFSVGKSQIKKDFDSTVVDIPKIQKPYITIQHFYNFLNDSLVGKRYSRHLGIKALKRWCSIFPEYEFIILSIFNKDLDCGISSQLINCIYPKLIPMFNPTHTRIWDSVCTDRKFDNYIILEKLEGVRIYVSIRNKKVNLYNDRAAHIKTLKYLQSEIQSFVEVSEINNIIIEGVVFIDNCNEEEMNNKIVRGKDILTNISFKVYDLLTIDEFEVYCDESPVYSKRHERLKEYGINNINMVEIIQIQQYDSNNKESLKYLKSVIDDNNWEGLMLRKNMHYEAKNKSYNMIKVYKNS
jgi:hypothetical protein